MDRNGIHGVHVPHTPLLATYSPRFMRIYLTGFMGSGKSTVGQKLAADLDWPFVDTDAWIEEQIGMRIPQYFAQEGEAAFRAREADALIATAAHRKAVVATGGGMLVDSDQMQCAQMLGAVVYLRVDVETLYERLAPDAAHRPLLWDEDETPLAGDALRRRIDALVSARGGAYEQASMHIRADAAPSVIARHIRFRLFETL